MPGNLLYHVLQFSPKADQLEGVVTPSRRDAKVCLMWGHVVYAMVLTRQNDVTLLQPLNDPRQLAIRVRPLVDLIGERDHDAESE